MNNAVNKKVVAKEKAIQDMAKVWGLNLEQTLTKFNQQPKKWQRKTVNAYLA